MNYYERHLGDYAKDTALLSQGQVGAYDLLLDYYYATEKPLPLDAADLHKITRATTPAERANTAKVLAHFFTKTDAGYLKGRVEEEIERYRAKSTKAAASANARWNAVPKQSKRNANAYANALPTDSKRIAAALPSQCVGNAHQSPEEQLPFPNGNGAEPVGDPVKRLFDAGVKLLVDAGQAELPARSFIGKLRKQYDVPVVLEAVLAAETEQPSDPAAWLVKACAFRAKAGAAPTMRTMPAGSSWK